MDYDSVSELLKSNGFPGNGVPYGINRQKQKPGQMKIFANGYSQKNTGKKNTV
jgi:hypothetical protein